MVAAEAATDLSTDERWLSLNGQDARVAVPWTWDDLRAHLDALSDVQEARVSADLLQRMRGRWSGRVDPHTWQLHGLRFTAPDDAEPYDVQVQVRWHADTFEVVLLNQARQVVAGDKCRDPSVEEVLDAFLVQLVGGEPPRA